MMETLKRTFRFIRDAWLIVGISLVILLAIELGLSLIFKARAMMRPPATNFRQDADTYDDRTWARNYYSEIDDIEQNRSLRWKPYVYWRRLPRNGQYINIDGDGLRKTVNPASVNGKTEHERIFVFGGSTVWGLGSADDETIPSLLSGIISDRGHPAEVVNYGQYAYVSTQGVIELMRQLQKGNIPDAVIFYDGVNDTFNAFQTNTPGLTHNEMNRELEYGLLDKGDIYGHASKSLIRSLSITRLFGGMLGRLRGEEGQFKPVSLKYEPSIDDRNRLIDAVVETYFNNIKMVKSLADSHGFTAQFYWQPVIFTKKRLTEYERESIEKDFYFPGMKEFYLDTYVKLRSRTVEGVPEFHDISTIFDETEKPIFVDFNHMGRKGNLKIAERMALDYPGIKTKNKGPVAEAPIE